MELFELNGKIDLVTGDDYVFSGLIYDFSDEKLYVSIPIDPAEDKDFKILHVGENLQGIVYLKTQLLGFDCVVSNRIHNDVPIYEISDIQNITKVQRRNDIRVPYTHFINYTGNKFLLELFDNEENTQKISSSISNYLKEGMMLDISGGGIKLSCNEDFSVNSSLLLELPLKDEKILIKGKIVHKEINMIPKNTKYLYGIKFLDISEKLKDRIIQFVFILMRKNINRL